MKARIFFLAAMSLPALACAQFKCTSTDGKVSFQQTPCEVSSKQQPLQLKSSPPQLPNPSRTTDGEPAARKGEGGTVEQRMVRQMEKDRRVRELDQQISDTEAAINGRNAAMNNELAALRSRKQFANNNLAGATYEQSLSSEMQAVAAKYKAMNDVDVARLQQLRLDVANARQIAGATQ